MSKRAAVASQQHRESETTCKEKVGAEENVNSQDPSTCSAAKQHTDSEQQPGSPHWYEYPDSEFHNFEEERSSDKFEECQIWALYSDMDKNPNYYGRTAKVESEEKFRVHVTWLEGCSEQEQERFWFEEQLPVGCGTFQVIQDSCVLDTTDTFSHLVHANPAGGENHYVIYPHVGEIWAVYKNWSLGWLLSDMENSEFDLVEILTINSSGFEVMVLSKLNGYRAVFVGERSGVVAKTMDIPYAERLKFSHKIPAFRLTEERGGKLRGYWELDPASVPDILLFTNSN